MILEGVQIFDFESKNRSRGDPLFRSKLLCLLARFARGYTYKKIDFESCALRINIYTEGDPLFRSKFVSRIY